MKKKRSTLAWGVVLTALIFMPFSCKKGIPPIDTTSAQTIEAGELPGLRQLMALNQVPDSVKDAFDLTRYQFYDKGYNGQHWIIALKKGAFNLEKAKIFVGLKKGQVSVIVLAYSYDEAAYVYGNFKTYTGIISIYDGRVRKVNDLRYKNGVLQQVIPPDCINCLLCYCPPPQPISWCTYWPQFCSTDHNDGVGQIEVPSPPDGGGGGPVYSATVNYLTGVLSLYPQHSLWLQLNQNIAEDIKSALEDDDLSIEAQTAAKNHHQHWHGQ